MGMPIPHPPITKESTMTKMKQVRTASVSAGAKQDHGRQVNNSQADKPSIDATANSKQKSDATGLIEFLGVGASGDGDRFLKRRVGDYVDLISVAKLISNPTAEYVRLQRAGLPLLQQAARTKFLEQAELEAGKAPTFFVARQPGLSRGRVCLPGDPVSAGPSDVEFYPDERHAPVYEKFLRAGTYEGWKKLALLCRGNSRLIFAYQLGFTGLVCAAFGLDPPGALFWGPPGWGKSTACKIPSAIWGWDPTPSTRIGFGFPWRTKVAALENYAAGCNHTLLFLDEMSKAKEEAIDAIMMVAHGHATARYTELTRQTWSEPLLTNSNKSLLAILVRLEFEFDAAYVDRLPDIPPPSGCTCYFEDLHGSPDVAAYEARLRALAERHHGWAGRHYGKQFERILGADPEELKAFVDAARQEYQQAAASITSSWRDLVRLHGRFATVYAAGCLGHRFGVLPLPRAELLDADLTIARDHVAFVEQEVRRLGLPVAPPSAPPTNAVRVGNSTAGALDSSPLAKLKQYLDANIPDGLIDLRDPETELPANHDHDHSPGYLGIHDKQVELWFSNQQFEKIAGGKHAGRTLKRALAGMHVLMVWGRGHGKVSPTVKRRLANLGLHWVVAIRPSAAMKARWPALRDCERQPLPLRREIRRSPFPVESHRLLRHIGKAQRALSPGTDVEVQANRRRQLPGRHAQGAPTRTRPHRD
jgi:hypothetical protein